LGHRLDRRQGGGYAWVTSRIEFPPDLYSTLISIWRSGAGRRESRPNATVRGAHSIKRPSLSREEIFSVAPRVKELSRGFTRARSLAGERYLSHPDLLGAYILHFWPISYAQARLCLDMIVRERNGAPPSHALDVGSGPGPFSLALLDAGVSTVAATDRSGAALSLARRIASERGYSLHTRQWDATKTTGMPEGHFDLITLGHTLNELWAGHPDRTALRVSFLQRVAESLLPGGRLLIVEPALMQTAREAIMVRDGLARAGFAVEMPCIWQADCPALPSSTCHGEFDWTPPQEMVRLAHAARIGRETLKMAWFVLRKPGSTTGSSKTGLSHIGTPAGVAAPDGGLYRVVSEPLLSKSGRIRYLVCGPQGRFALSARKDCPGAGVKPFFSLKRTYVIRFFGSKSRESGWGLEESSRVEVIERPPKIGREPMP
jgi:SAM-dependent methyltransferase